jgi:hypothetical protein
MMLMAMCSALRSRPMARSPKQQTLHRVTTPSNMRLRILGPAPHGSVCLFCYRADGEVLRIANAAALGSKAETLHQACAEQWFSNTRNTGKRR